MAGSVEQNLCFILFELIIYPQLALCLGHAWKQGTANVLAAGMTRFLFYIDSRGKPIIIDVTTVTFSMATWLLLHYKLPSKPSALRVYIWRKLKRVGAILLHDAVWVLPDNARTAEQVQWLAAEIKERGGEAYYWRAGTILGEQEESIVQQFKEQVDAMYADLLKRLRKPRADLQEISKQYQQAASQDFFKSKLGLQVRQELTSKRGAKS